MKSCIRSVVTQGIQIELVEEQQEAESITAVWRASTPGSLHEKKL